MTKWSLLLDFNAVHTKQIKFELILMDTIIELSFEMIELVPFYLNRGTNYVNRKSRENNFFYYYELSTHLVCTHK